ncbi:tRNA 4-thiouridine(8) synthase ThiI [Tuanshanicoccus lijuaniae]|uniref:tRNA uracil 4-sulfurtransferase ThiI n=1 Tax=Aerococcaceae bacterium zg-1292 TaxID=2774330 RepID=UPI001934EC34|nr:tRNA 4-thiouridine(8) synthase ThiI [Aerococcaceae bacterium zg-1292]QQA36731.1 tRNA 4-thiouridine(8) synthase ThiI [Aerococcaceae bacterium zg-1292]
MQQIVIHYGELSTKGRNRKSFQNRLGEHIRQQTKHLERIKIVANHDFMHLTWETAPIEDVVEILKTIPGISRFEPVHRVEKDIDAIKEKAVELFEQIDLQAGDTYRVVVKRSDKSFEYDTMSLQREVGFKIGETFPMLNVDLRHAKHKLTISIHQNTGANLSLTSYAGLGGLPYGSSGKGLLMLSGGFDSPIAGYQMIKRGLEIEAVHFSSPPYTSPQALDKTKHLTAVLAKYAMPIQFLNVPFTKIQEAIKENIPEDYSMTIMRRMMLRIMDGLLEKRHGQAIVTGESLGQVASQTLTSMHAINAVTATPILRPLIAVDKTEIIQQAEQIGTYAISNEPYEDCCTVFAPSSPRTKPKLDRVEVMEQALDIDALVQEAIDQTTAEVIDAQYIQRANQRFADWL